MARDYTIKNVNGHFEVFDGSGQFICSGDSYTEALLTYMDILDEEQEKR